jgi:hypothetical protein
MSYRKAMFRFAIAFMAGVVAGELILLLTEWKT